MTTPLSQFLEPSAEPEKPLARDGGVTFRVCVLCLGLAVFFGAVIPVIDIKLGNTFLGAQHLPPGAIGTLLVFLLLVNPLLRWGTRNSNARALCFSATGIFGALAFWARLNDWQSGAGFWLAAFAALLCLLGWSFKKPLSRNELLTIYISCLFSCLVPGHGAENFVVSNLVAPFYFATPENKWLESLAPYLPAWSTPVLWIDPAQKSAATLSAAGRSVTDPFYLGGQIPWSAWMVPLGFWIGFVALSYMMLGCFSVLMRAQWAQHEALAFPLNQLALELTEDSDDLGKHSVGAFFRNPTMWMGFGVAVIMQGLNGLHLYFPDVPKIEWDVNTAPFFSNVPWNQMGWTPIQIYPVAIGLAFLLTSEIGFSLWFFALFMRFQFMAAYTFGYPPGGAGGRDFTTFQIIGAATAYAILVMWTARAHLKFVARRALGLERAKPDERDEFLSYPVAFWGFVGSTIGVISTTHLLGANWVTALLLWIGYFITAIGMTRLIVEGGLLYVGNSWRILDGFAQLGNGSPQTWLPANTIAPATLVQSAFMLDMRAFLMPSFVQSFKLAHDNGLQKRRLLALISAIIALTLVMGFLMRIKLSYETGALGFHPFFAKNGATIWAGTTRTLTGGVQNVNNFNWSWFAVGALATLGMFWLRSRFAWFPLHPIGLLIPLSYPLTTLWFSIFCGWLAKTVANRMGGQPVVRAARPLFLGLAFGDISMMLVWLLIDGWQGRTFHYLVPT